MTDTLRKVQSAHPLRISARRNSHPRLLACGGQVSPLTPACLPQVGRSHLGSERMGCFRKTVTIDNNMSSVKKPPSVPVRSRTGPHGAVPLVTHSHGLVHSCTFWCVLGLLVTPRKRTGAEQPHVGGCPPPRSSLNYLVRFRSRGEDQKLVDDVKGIQR